MTFDLGHPGNAESVAYALRNAMEVARARQVAARESHYSHELAVGWGSDGESLRTLLRIADAVKWPIAYRIMPHEWSDIIAAKSYPLGHAVPGWRETYDAAHNAIELGDVEHWYEWIGVARGESPARYAVVPTAMSWQAAVR